MSIALPPVSSSAPSVPASGQTLAPAAMDATSAGSNAATQTAVSDPSAVRATTSDAPVSDSPETQAAQALAQVRTQAAATPGGLAPLMADLEQATQNASLPNSMQTVLTQLLSLRLSVQDAPTADDIQSAFLNSGLFTESQLAAQANDPSSSVSVGGDLKSLLLVLKQTAMEMVASQPEATASATSFSAASSAPASSGAPVSAGTPSSPMSAASTADATAQTTGAASSNAASANVQISDGPTSPVPTTGAMPSPVASNAVPSSSAQSASASAGSPAVAGDTPDAAAAMPSQTSSSSPAATASPAASPLWSETNNPAAQLAAATANMPALATALPQGGPLASFPTVALLQAIGLLKAMAAPEPTASSGTDDDSNSSSDPSDSTASKTGGRLPVKGGPTSAQSSASAQISSEDDAATVGRRLMSDSEAALAHQKLLQLASLPEQTSTKATGAHWMFEIPLTTPQGTTIAQFAIDKDGGGEDQDGKEKEVVWRARFSVDVEPLGPVHASVAIGQEEKTWVTLWADRRDTLNRLKADTDTLTAALQEEDLTAEIAFRPVSTPKPVTILTGHFLDHLS